MSIVTATIAPPAWGILPPAVSRAGRGVAAATASPATAATPPS